MNQIASLECVMRIAVLSYQVRAGCESYVVVELPFLESWIRHCIPLYIIEYNRDNLAQ